MFNPPHGTKTMRTKSYNDLQEQYNRIVRLWVAADVTTNKRMDRANQRMRKTLEILKRYTENIYNYYNRYCAVIDRNKGTRLPASVYAKQV